MAGIGAMKAFASAAILIAAGGLAACSSAPVKATTGSFKSLYATLTGGDVEPTRRLKVRVDQEAEPVCPEMIVVPGQAAYTLYDKKSEASLDAVTYQGTLTRVARECEFVNGTLSMKFGFAGRLVVGPRGKTGKVVLPVEVAFMQDAQKEIWRKQFKVGVDVPDGARSTDFVHVEGAFTYPIPEGDTLLTHQLRVFFEGGQAEPSRTVSQPNLAF